LDAPRFIGRDALLEIEIDDGGIIHATPEHQFMRRDGRMTEAHALRSGDALMPLYRDTFRGYEALYQPIDGLLYPTHRLAGEWNVRNGIYAQLPGTHRHHIDFNHRNNLPSNIVRLAASRRAKQVEIARTINFRSEITEDRLRRAMDDAGSIRGAAALLKCDRSVFRRFPEMLARYRGTPAYRNHKIARVRELRGEHDVYCLTVPEAGNFALEAGVFVHNCGIIVNVTPLEPEWEGHVTLEFSNTTPLPARIYANEGVAQMLFFESDEVCGTSYADRGGKYQGQRGVTLPKA
jgi:dCTP deaminase